MKGCSREQHTKKQKSKIKKKFQNEAQERGGNEGGRSMNGAKEGDSGSSLLGTAG